MSRLYARFSELCALSGPALIDEEGAFAFVELGRASATIGATLLRRGLGGRRIGLLAAPTRRWVSAFWGVQTANGSVVALSPLHPIAETARLLQQSRTRAVLCDRGFADPLSNLGFEVIPLEPLIETGHPESSEVIPKPTLERNPPPGEAPADPEAREALVLFTSGTTGRPKVVPWSARQLLAGASVLAEHWGFRADDVLVHCLPLHHLHGICVALLTATLSGACTRLLQRFEPSAVFDACARASVLMAVPTQHHRLLAHFDALEAEGERAQVRDALRRLRLITSGSAKLPERIGRRIEELSGQYPLERYGMTEVGIVLSNPLAAPRKPGSCGRLVNGATARVVDERGRDVELGAPGELWVAGPTVFSGYDADPDATRTAFDAEFFKTGDIVSRDAEGWFSVLGRSSIDIIKSGGYKLSALEIEEALREHPGVEEIAVVGIPDEQWGECAIALVIARPPVSADLTHELRAWAKQHLAAYKVPRDVRLVERLPRNAMGKVEKHVLVAALARDRS